jgi:pimeloyl-ACP methyl ester carboxylesterase
VLTAAAIGVAGPAPAATAARGQAPVPPQACGGTGTATTATGSLPDGAAYEFQCPPGPWNGTLFLFSHGYVAPGGSNPAQDTSDPVTAAWLLSQGYALAGSSYATTGWSIQQAIPDQMAALGTFGAAYGKPARTIAWGGSLGGMITAGLIQDHPNQFSGALPACGPLSGGVPTWNTELDAAFAFQQLIDPSAQVTHITDPSANLTSAEAALALAQQTPQGRARVALVTALSDVPGWFTPGSPQPAAGDYAGQEANQYAWASQVTFPFAFAFRAELEARAGGNPSWNTGVDYAADLARSTGFREVRALYKGAGLSLRGDLAALDQAPRVAADPAAVRYLNANISYTGRISVPVLTLHTTGDGLVVPENERAYARAVDRAGDARLLRPLYVNRAGHCAFTPAEEITAIGVLMDRLNSGRWHVPSPAELNAEATALGPRANVLPPAFAEYEPAPYLRPNLLPWPIWRR